MRDLNRRDKKGEREKVEREGGRERARERKREIRRESGETRRITC